MIYVSQYMKMLIKISTLVVNCSCEYWLQHQHNAENLQYNHHHRRMSTIQRYNTLPTILLFLHQPPYLLHIQHLMLMKFNL